MLAKEVLHLGLKRICCTDEDVLTEISSIDDAASSGSEAGAAAASKPSRARTGADTASVASTWRPERTDRHPNLSFIDER